MNYHVIDTLDIFMVTRKVSGAIARVNVAFLEIFKAEKIKSKAEFVESLR